MLTFKKLLGISYYNKVNVTSLSRMFASCERHVAVRTELTTATKREQAAMPKRIHKMAASLPFLVVGDMSPYLKRETQKVKDKSNERKGIATLCD